MAPPEIIHHAFNRRKSISALKPAKTRYAERGEVNSCSDWLAVELKDAFRTEDGSFELTAFKACLKENGIEPPKVDENKYGGVEGSECALV